MSLLQQPNTKDPPPRKHTPTHTQTHRCRQRSTDTTEPSSFAGQVKLHSILIRTSQSASAPKTLKVFQNREDVDFEAAEDAPAEQEFELSQASEVQDLPVKRAKFGKVQRLALFFPDNFGDGDEDVTRISYLGFKGEWMQLGRAPANILVSD